MHNRLTSLPRLLKTAYRHLSPARIAPLALGVSIWCSGALIYPNLVRAQTSQTPPAALATLIEQIDEMANQRKLREVMQFYDRNLAHSDGLTHRRLSDTLSQLWKRYPQLTYDTTILSWRPEGTAFIVETETLVSGEQDVKGQTQQFKSTIRSRQRVENGRIVRQDILSERTEVTAGDNPPTVRMNLPEQVRIGQRYSLDAIVQEPLGNDLLLGGVSEMPARANNYLTTLPANLDLLSAGGIYKQAVAPARPEERWISVVLIRGGGMTMITQRLRVTER
ncbi:nuclear transport factor 2 family protein [Desertifilum sp. FACHB-1129]|uniref:Nuclear transport factor 2 family protein n=2 Tax=Desertifilum tharense IPPAS B-1220 TaxID=1781255 RepID=A0A1E5QPP6_9CYAN|nr:MULTISPECIES: hypothetical protein [Desertifilum]MCD8488177.1 nuclear transport factor 2 family protein [Desertifilum sp.]MDA0209838.1 nuclear transport factor 2 family protein [Cyanobacteria bacterium FC1]MBD2310672.1 nuclear transport factor 2 family protein [Desertifilum sp. FACHB-1129]MBD2320709.1 nuclear transport factor 2 family protein [Desertifilum sp. FACHB-866]MBD2330837.1 nuclear transport factor 2 family protein [Desertifilum sp. FACHB-868]